MTNRGSRLSFAPILMSSLIGDSLLAFLIPLLVYAKTQDLAMSGLAYFIEWLPRMILVPVIGRWVDSWGIRRTSICSDLIKICACLSFLLVLLQLHDAKLIAILAGLLGSLIALSNAQTILVYEKYVAENSEQVERDANLISRADQLAMVFGPLLGFLLFAYGSHWLVLAALPGYLINLVFFLRYRHEAQDKQQQATMHRQVHHRINTWNILRKTWIAVPAIGAIALCSFFSNMLDGTVEASGVAALFEKIKLPIEYFAFINIAAGCSGTLATMIFEKLHVQEKEKQLLASICILEFCAGLGLFVFYHTLLGLLGFYALCIGLKIMRITMFRIYRIRMIESQHFATVTSILSVFAQLALPLVGLIIYFSARLGIEPQQIILAAAIMVLISSLWAQQKWPRPISATSNVEAHPQ